MDELSEALGESLGEMIERGFEPPLWVAVISINGCTLTFRYDADADPSTGGLSPTLLTSHASEALRLPINVGLEALPPWLREAVDAYLSWYWPSWRARSAAQLGRNLISLVRRIGTWLTTQRKVESWETLRRADLEAWLQARGQDKVSAVTIRNDFFRFRGVLKFLEIRDYPLDPGLFRVQPPQIETKSLPRYLTEVDYRRLEKVVLQTTEAETYPAYFDRAWFLTLAHTGVRVSELLDLRLGDLNLAAGYATIRGGKPGRDRVVFLTPALLQAARQGSIGRVHPSPRLPPVVPAPFLSASAPMFPSRTGATVPPGNRFALPIRVRMPSRTSRGLIERAPR